LILNMKLFHVFILGLILLAACKPDVLKKPASQADYYGLKVGRHYIYNADSIQYSGNANYPNDTIHYQLKDSIESSYKDQTGQTAYRIYEYRRNTSSMPWQYVRVFSRTSNSAGATETDDNITYLKLIYPIVMNESWNPDKYNTTDSFGNYLSQYIQINTPATISNLKFDSTVYVQIQNELNLVDTFRYYERYAANVGLVFMEHDSDFINKQQPHPDFNTGYRLKYTLIDYGPR